SQPEAGDQRSVTSRSPPITFLLSTRPPAYCSLATPFYIAKAVTGHPCRRRRPRRLVAPGQRILSSSEAPMSSPLLSTNHTSFTVRSLDETLPFFTEVLGFEVTSRDTR